MIIEHDSMPIVIAKDYKRIDQKLTIFGRGLWDSKITPLLERYEESHANLRPPSRVTGFTKLERALKSAAWSICLDYAPGNEYGRADSGFYAWDGEKNPWQITFKDRQEASLILKNAAKFFGANLAGIAKYDPRWVYSSWFNFSTQESIPPEFPFEIKSVIVLAIETDYSACRTSPSLISCAATGLGYSRMAEISKKLASFIRLLGYNAIPSGNDTALSIPIAVQAGLGEVGRNGMLITPQYGPRVRLLKLFTDMPLQADRPITFGVSQFCMKCKKCAQSCPAGAIPMEPKPTMTGMSISNCSGVLKWYTNPESCFKFWALNGGECNNCIACCPYNKWSSWHHGLTQNLTESIEKKPLFALQPKITDKGLNALRIDQAAIEAGPSAVATAKFLGESGINTVEDALCRASWAINKEGLNKWDVKPYKNKTEFQDPEEAALIIKKAAKFLGADSVGIAAYVGNGFPFKAQSVIVMAVGMDYEAYRTEPSLIATAATGQGYSRMAETALKVAAFIRQLGYKAVPSGDTPALSIPLAIMAGLGECGKNGLLITKDWGPRVRLCKVFTELELKADKPVTFGVKDFCASCTICAEACPAQAIPSDFHCSETGKQGINAEKCFQFWLDQATDCCKCITACPFNKPASWDQELKRAMADIPLASVLGKPNASAASNKILDPEIITNWWKKG